MSPRPFLSIEQVLTLLAETPIEFAAMTKGLSATQLHRPTEPGEWSLNDVLAHLRSCADARGEFIRAILAEKRPTLRAIDPRTLILKTDYPDLKFGRSFRAFARQRASLLKLLKTLSKKSWSRTAIVTGGGLARERTVLFYAQWVARHEGAHVKHIRRTVAKMRPTKRPAVQQRRKH